MFNRNPYGSQCGPVYGQQVSQYPPNRGRQPPMGNQFPPTGNVICVDNLEHALSMPTGYHSENVYFDSHQNLMYRVYTNELGEKSYLIFELLVHNATQSQTPITQEAFNNALARISTLEDILEVSNGKSNVSTNAGSNSTNPATGQSNAQ